MKNFFLNLSVITAFAGIVGYFTSANYPIIDFFHTTLLCIYFFSITGISHWSITGEKNNSKFPGRYLLVTFSKFLFSLLILLAYVFLRPVSAVPFIILFAFYYLLFTVFEVLSLVRYFRGAK